MHVPPHLCRTIALLTLIAAPLVSPARAQELSRDTATCPQAVVSGTAAAELQRVQSGLVLEATTSYRARAVATLPGWQQTIRDVERLVEKPWIGSPPVILVVPSVGGRGFRCDGRDTCLGRFVGANITVRGSDSTLTTMSSIIVIAESALTRRDVWAHELTHALLAQHGLSAESARHDRRYFAEAQFVTLGF
jgi:hypothetical protein